MIPSWLHILAYVFLNLAAVPAILKMRRRKSSADISLAWQGMILTGVFVIFLYAVQTGDLVFIIGGIMNVVGISSVIATAMIYR